MAYFSHFSLCQIALLDSKNKKITCCIYDTEAVSRIPDLWDHTTSARLFLSFSLVSSALHLSIIEYLINMLINQFLKSYFKEFNVTHSCFCIAKCLQVFNWRSLTEQSELLKQGMKYGGG